jgi:hypothetical protein
LAARPVWLFSSGPIGDPPKPEEDPVDIADIMQATKARGHRVFAGKLVKKQLSFPDRAISAAPRVPEGDFRDREEIKAWAARSPVPSGLDPDRLQDARVQLEGDPDTGPGGGASNSMPASAARNGPGPAPP